MGGGPPDFPQGSTCLTVLRILPDLSRISHTGLSPPAVCLPSAVLLSSTVPSSQSITPVCTHTGLGSSHFARRYFGNRCFFLFLRLLRCFSSPGSPRMAMYSPYGDGGLLRRVSPFGYLRITGYLRLPAAFRSLLRPSSALSAKASTLRSCLLTSRRRYLLFGATEMSPLVRRFSGTSVSPAGRLFLGSLLCTYLQPSPHICTPSMSCHCLFSIDIF